MFFELRTSAYAVRNAPLKSESPGILASLQNCLLSRQAESAVRIVSSREPEIEAEGKRVTDGSEWCDRMAGKGVIWCRSVVRVPASRLDGCRRAEPRSGVLGVRFRHRGTEILYIPVSSASVKSREEDRRKAFQWSFGVIKRKSVTFQPH
jgi:hypothetical protein